MPSIYDFPFTKKLVELGHSIELQRDGREHKTICPGHNDENPSLSMTVDDSGKFKIKCVSAGCSTTHICNSIGLQKNSLYLPTEKKKKTNKKIKYVEVARYPYRDEDGETLYWSIRQDYHDPKTNEKITDSEGKVKKKFSVLRKVGGKNVYAIGDAKRVPYRLPELLAENKEDPVFIVEGEKSADKLAKGGLIAITNLGGANKWRDEYSPYLEGRICYVIADNDSPGEIHAQSVAKSIHDFAASVRIIRLPDLPKKGDVIDWIAANPENKPSKLFEIAANTEQWNPATSDDELYNRMIREKPDDDLQRLAYVIVARNSANGVPMIRYYRGSWWMWEKTHWEQVEQKFFHSKMLHEIADEFSRLFELRTKNADPGEAEKVLHMKVSDRLASGTMNAMVNLVGISGRRETPLILDAAKGTWSESRELISVKNGIIDLRSVIGDEYGNVPPADDFDAHSIELLPHTPELFNPNYIPHMWNPDAEFIGGPWWDYLIYNFDGDERTSHLMEWFGYLIQPSNDQQKFMIFHGDGSNGKSVALTVIRALLGTTNTCSITLESFRRQFGMAKMLSNLVAICPDADDEHSATIAEGAVKSFVAGDEMEFEEKFKAAFDATPYCRFMMSCNKLPTFKDRSEGMWRRILSLKFEKKVAESKVDTRMVNVKFWNDQPKEMEGILLLAVQHLHGMRVRKKFVIPERSRQLIETHRFNIHSERGFLNQFFVEGDGHVPVGIYKEYVDHCKDSGQKPLSKNNFQNTLFSMFPAAEKKRVGKDREWSYEGVVRRASDF